MPRKASPLTLAKQRIAHLERALRDADLAAEVGLCSFSFGAVREYLKDVRKHAASVGIQGGISAYENDRSIRSGVDAATADTPARATPKV